MINAGQLARKIRSRRMEDALDQPAQSKVKLPVDLRRSTRVRSLEKKRDREERKESCTPVSDASYRKLFAKFSYPAMTRLVDPL